MTHADWAVEEAKKYVTREDDGRSFSAFVFGHHIGTEKYAASRDSMHYFPALKKVAASLAAARAGGLEEGAKLIPTNWLDPLLSGPTSVTLGNFEGPGIERLLRAVTERLRAAARAPKETPHGSG